MKNLTYLFHSRFGKYLKLILIFCAAFLTGRLLAKITSSEIISPDITALSVSSDPSGNWGLSFQEKGKQPLGNASIQELKQYNAFYVQDTNSKNIYLTFDAGYENGNTSAILDALKKHHFLCGRKFSIPKSRSDQANGKRRTYHRQSHYDSSKYVQNFYKRSLSEGTIRCGSYI